MNGKKHDEAIRKLQGEPLKRRFSVVRRRFEYNIRETDGLVRTQTGRNGGTRSLFNLGTHDSV